MPRLAAAVVFADGGGVAGARAQQVFQLVDGWVEAGRAHLRIRTEG
jgi:hypothetical protein